MYNFHDLFLDLYRCLYVHDLDYPSYALMYICFLYRENHLLGMGNCERCEGGEGPYELPPSCGWTCLVENNLFSKQREAQ
jgi:hypothetical protein